MLITHKQTKKKNDVDYTSTELENDVDCTHTEWENNVDHRDTQLDMDVDHTRDVDHTANLITYGFWYFNLALRIGTRKIFLCHKRQSYMKNKR